LLAFYKVYCPFFTICVKPLCTLECQHHRTPIPTSLWMPLSSLYGTNWNLEPPPLLT
jgi:hypothetical protein